MISKAEYKQAQHRAAEMIRDAGIPVRPEEFEKIEVADFGLENLEAEGAQILTLFATERIAGKVIVLLPGQSLPEHWHGPVGDDPGKQEVLRVAAGSCCCVRPGGNSLRFATIPEGKQDAYTCRQETVMRQGDQLVLEPGTKHWLQAGPQGAVVYSFSTCARDALDEFTDPQVVRRTVIADADE
jgi:D-lyxose ketol-isomerase